MSQPRITWIRAGDRYPDLKDDLDNFLMLDPDGRELGVVKWVESGPDHGWFWSMLATAPGPAFKRPMSGRCTTRGQAVRELGECYAAFREWFGIVD